MRISIFLIILLILLISILIFNFIYSLDNFISKYNIDLNISKIIIVNNKNYILLHFKNNNKFSNKIFKIYKYKFILYKT